MLATSSTTSTEIFFWCCHANRSAKSGAADDTPQKKKRWVCLPATLKRFTISAFLFRAGPSNENASGLCCARGVCNKHATLSSSPPTHLFDAL